MKKLLLLLLSFTIFYYSYSAEVWLSDDPNALIKRIEIYDNTHPIQLPNSPTAYINITFRNDVVYAGLPLNGIFDPFAPDFLIPNDYIYYTIYYCQTLGLLEQCDGIALRFEENKLCIGYFRQSQLDRWIQISGSDCFHRKELIRVPVVSLNYLDKLNKEQLIDIIIGRKPIDPPIGPVCLSCPPWKDYEQEFTKRLSSAGNRKFELTLKEVKNAPFVFTDANLSKNLFYLMIILRI